MTTQNKSQLDLILTEALEQNFETVEFERARSAGLEVTFISGGNGYGSILPKEQEQPTLDDLFERVPNLWDKWSGRFKFHHHEKDHVIKVEVFDSFGENAFRLRIR